jgi:predicted nuclease of predicted toxin-antitoxin system
MTAVRFMLDEHIDRAVASGLRRRGVAAQTVHEIGRRGVGDEEHLRWAFAQGWVIVSGDEDFLRLVRGAPNHAGLVYYQRTRFRIGSLVRRLHAIATAETLESMSQRVVYL